MPRGHCSNLCETCPMSGMVSLYFDPEAIYPDNLAEGVIDEANIKGVGLEEAANEFIEDEFYGKSANVKRVVGECILKVARGDCAVNSPRNELSAPISDELARIGDNEMAQSILGVLMDANLDMSGPVIQRLRLELSEMVADDPERAKKVLNAHPEDLLELAKTILKYSSDQ